MDVLCVRTIALCLSSGIMLCIFPYSCALTGQGFVRLRTSDVKDCKLILLLINFNWTKDKGRNSRYDWMKEKNCSHLRWLASSTIV